MVKRTMTNNIKRLELYVTISYSKRVTYMGRGSEGEEIYSLPKSWVASWLMGPELEHFYANDVNLTSLINKVNALARKQR